MPKFLIPLLVGLIVLLVGLSLGFNCGFAINPARDLGPRILTAMAGYGVEVFRYVSILLFHKFPATITVYCTSSYRDYHWFLIPILGPHIGAILGTVIYMLFVGLHWPQTFEKSDIAQIKSELEHQHQLDSDKPADLADPSFVVVQPTTTNSYKKPSVSFGRGEIIDINQMRENYMMEKEQPNSVNLIARF